MKQSYPINILVKKTKIPGRRAAELSFYLTKWKQNFAYDRITMITIDQLKASMSLKSQYEQADERTVGIWRNTKAATGVKYILL